MKKITTKVAEEIYSVLTKYAEASSNHYDREGFIYTFAVVPNPIDSFELNCMDGKKRSIVKDGTYVKLNGPGDSKVNSIIKHIIDNAASDT